MPIKICFTDKEEFPGKGSPEDVKQGASINLETGEKA